MSDNPEQSRDSQEYNIEPNQSAAEKLEQLNNTPEQSIESKVESSETRTENARTEALEMAISVESTGKKTEVENKPSNTPRHSTISKQQKNDSYKRTVKRIQSELPAADRAFSKVIHNKTIEKASEIVGSSVARPNSILCGAFSAFILTLATYSIAKKIGYQLSGSETLIAFSLGWLIGLLFDYFRTLFTGKR